MRGFSVFFSVGVAAVVLAFNASAADSNRPLIRLLTAEQVEPYCSKGLKQLQRDVKTLEKLPKPKAGDAKPVLAQWNRLQIKLEDLQGPVEVLNNMSPEPKVRANSEACLVEINKFATDLYQSEKLYARFKAIQPTDAIDRKARKDALENFDDTGVSLPPKKRARMKEILNRMEELSQTFARDIRDNNQKLSFTPDELKGLPDAYKARAKRDDQGNYLLGFEYPEYIPFMEYAENADARRRYQFAFSNRGTPKNLELLKEAINLRHEMAGLFGLPSYAHFALRRRMAKTPETVYKFLNEVQVAVSELEKKELEELRLYKAEILKLPPADAKLERWDTSYWQEKLKQARYSIDQNALRKYFPTVAAMDWAMSISGTLYGVEFKPVSAPVWHDDVRYFDVFDSASRKRIAGIYLDIFPRPGKYSHAAAFPVRGVSTLAGRTPISVLVANFDRNGLDANELETMVHEFGHVLHGTLSATRYVMQAGTSVERDFVEAPSQMYEEWARRKESLALLSKFCKSPCPTVDEELVKRMTAAHNYGRGIRYARQLLYADYDMHLHDAHPADPLELWDKMESATPLGHVPGTQFPGQFGHLMGGYAAGYYGYMWSEVLALDMLSRYDDKLLNPQIGRQYRKAILSRGSEETGDELVRHFLGRAPNSKAFYDEILGKRLQ